MKMYLYLFSYGKKTYVGSVQWSVILMNIDEPWILFCVCSTMEPLGYNVVLLHNYTLMDINIKCLITHTQCHEKIGSRCQKPSKNKRNSQRLQFQTNRKMKIVCINFHPNTGFKLQNFQLPSSCAANWATLHPEEIWFSIKGTKF